MDISYLGHSSFLIKSKTTRIVTDPFDPKMVGLKYPKQQADIVTLSHQHDDHNFIKGVSEEAHVFDWPGEYEVNSIRIFGYQSFHDESKGGERGDNTIFKFDLEGIEVVHLGDLGHMPDDKLVDALGDVDVLMVPVGGFYTIDSVKAAQVVKKLDPALVIPMHYAREGLAPSLAEKLEPVDAFLQKMGVDAPEPVDKLSIKADDLTDKEMQVVVMK